MRSITFGDPCLAWLDTNPDLAHQVYSWCFALIVRGDFPGDIVPGFTPPVRSARIPGADGHVDIRYAVHGTQVRILLLTRA